MDCKALMAGPTTALTDSTAVTVPITTTQQILVAQFVSRQIFKPVNLSTFWRFRMVVRGLESNAAANAHLATRVNVVAARGDGTVQSWFSSMATATEFGVAAETRLLGNSAFTTLAGSVITIREPWRLVVEVGIHAQAPASAQTALLRFGCAAASDFAFTSALTTDLNPYCELQPELDNLGPGFQHLRGFVIG
jgi:hypothetical protein